MCFVGTALVAVIIVAAPITATTALARGRHANQRPRALVSRPIVHSGASSIPSPSPNSYLTAVSCATTASCWAVGESQNSAGTFVNEALHFNGKKWSLAKTPQPGGTASGDLGMLDGVWCTGTSHCWAVGSFRRSGGPLMNEILRWNGTRWSIAKAPQPGGHGTNGVNDLDAVTCASRSDCWATGLFAGASGGFINQALHWNGKRWSHVRAPNPGGTATSAYNILEGVSCTSASDCWAVGDFETSAYRNQALHWNGKRWSRDKVPQPGARRSGILASVSCTSGTSCSAVGSYTTAAGATLNETFRFNGKKWRNVLTPSPGGTGFNDSSQLTGVACPAKSSCWTVGYSAEGLSAPDLAQALRWNGKKWKPATTAQPGGSGTGDFTEPEAVSCASARVCWAVGHVGDGTESLNLALRWNGKKWGVN